MSIFSDIFAGHYMKRRLELEVYNEVTLRSMRSSFTNETSETSKSIRLCVMLSACEVSNLINFTIERNVKYEREYVFIDVYRRSV